MKALVTGVGGNLGQAMVEALSGWETTELSRHDLMSEPEGPFDLVVMAHGVQEAAELQDPNFFLTYVKVNEGNLDTAVHLTWAVLPEMNPDGLIVYCSSIQATQPRRGRGPYAIAKAGLEALAKIVSVEGTRAVALRLGQLDAQMENVVFSQQQLDYVNSRLLTPLVPVEDVARFILHLYSHKSLTGTVIDYDSGHHLNVW